MTKHWILDSFGEDNLHQALAIANKHLVELSLQEITGQQPIMSEDDVKRVEKSIEALELTGIDLKAVAFDPTKDIRAQRELFQSVCKDAFFLLRALPIPSNGVEKAKWILRLIAFAYLGQKWADVKRWLDENNSAWEEELSKSSEWDERLFGTIYLSWLHLIRKQGWEDLSQATKNIVQLRADQAKFEEKHLSQGVDSSVRGAAWEIVSLYHLAKATELLGQYMLQGTPKGILENLDFHFEKAIESSQNAMLMEMEILLRWLHLAAKQMANNSLWMVVARFNSRVKNYVESITRASKPMFELLPPQRTAILEQGLLEPAHMAVVVDMPTSSGKTALAEFRILQALNQFQDQNGWVAYVVPTRTLVNQITARLKRNLGGGNLGLRVVKMSGAVEVDGFEEAILTDKSNFDVLVTTPEKLDLIVRADVETRMGRPLVLVVLDEAHNIADKTRGLKIELLLATVKRDCTQARFLLLTPYIANSEEIASWLDPQSPGTISLGLSWQANERVVGLISPVRGEKPRNWILSYNTLMTSHPTIHLPEKIPFGADKIPIDCTWSEIRNNKTALTAAISNVFKKRGAVIAVARTIKDTWTLARLLYKNSVDKEIDENVKLVQRFVASEMGDDFELVKMLDRGIGLHHAGLSDEIRFLMEWLTEEGLLDVLVATTTIAQGINFPVSSIFVASLSYPYVNMPTRDFWNLAGRAGRFDQGTLGVIGIASNSDEDAVKIGEFVGKAGESLVSTLVELYQIATKAGKELSLEQLVYLPQWSSFVQYISHIYRQSQNLSEITANTELILRHTYGYQCLRKSDPDAANSIVQAVRTYARKLSTNPGLAFLADQTGFSPEAVGNAILSLGELGLKKESWNRSNLFDSEKSPLKNLIGVMLSIPEVKDSLEKITGHRGIEKQQIAAITQDWVRGSSMRELAEKYFVRDSEDIDIVTAISDCCSAIYGKLINSATWGMASLQKLPTSGLEFEKLDENEKRMVTNLPALIYYGVPSEEALLMRMNSVPRSIADSLGKTFRSEVGELDAESPSKANKWLEDLSEERWHQSIPKGSRVTGTDMKKIWSLLNGNTQ